MSTRWRSWIAVADVVVLGAAMGLVFLRSAQPISVDEAVRRYRETQPTVSDVKVRPTRPSRSTDHPAVLQGPTTPKASPKETRSRAAGSPGAPTLPGEGVYVYGTSGWEQVSMPGGRHDYPASTTITVRHAGCGVTTRWDALVERWDERETCPSAEGEQLRSLTSYHEFFRHGERLVYRCRAGSMARPSTAQARARWSGACDSDGSAARFQGVVIGRERLSVGGRQVETVHIRVDTSISGDTTGTNVHEDWLLPDSGLLIREISITDADVRGPFGTVHYKEHYELALASLEPRT
jgi:hypothetical protein